MPEQLEPEHWRERAREARRLAEQMADDEARLRMLRIAEDYEKIAGRAVRRIVVKQQPSTDSR